MTSTATTPDEYISELPENRKTAIEQLRQVFLKHLPKGFNEGMGYGMIGYVVPHSMYPAGYHCDPKQALPFISIASQKNYIAVHHMGLYASPILLEWFTSEYPKYSKTKLDMGKGCIRFKKPDQIPFDLVAALAEKVTPEQWIEQYESAFKSPKK